MGFIAILGSGPIGSATAHKLAGRDRVAEVRLVDAEARIARGKALDIMQASPIEQFSTRVTAGDSWTAAVGADVIIVADDATSAKELTGESALAMLRQLSAVERRAPLVFAGAHQRELMAHAVSELHVPRERVIGSAPLALESAVRALAGVLLDAAGTEVCLRIVGVPPHGAVVAWEAATASGLPLSSQLPAHAIAALTAKLPRIWPPGAYALGSAATRVVEGIAEESRKRYSCFVSLDRGSRRNAVAAMPVELAARGIRRVLEPALTRQEQTLLENGIS
jgi:malate dehydrogenase